MRRRSEEVEDLKVTQQQGRSNGLQKTEYQQQTADEGKRLT